MSYDPFHVDIDEIVQILHPTEALKKMAENKAPTTKIRCEVFNISSELDAERYEDIVSKCAHGQGKRLIKQETHFDKQGNYIIAIHWEEEIKNEPKPPASGFNSD